MPSGLMRSARLCTRGWLGVAVMAAAPGSVQAQYVEGRVSRDPDGSPLASVYVVLASDSSGELARAITGTDGTFSLPIQRNGRYFLRAEVIGYETTPSEAFTATTRETTRVNYTTELARVRLVAPPVSSHRCESPQAPDITPVFNETMKALRAVEATARRGDLSLRARVYQRVSRSGGHVVRETDSIVDEVREPPFFEYSAENIATRYGYVLDLVDGSQAYAVPRPTDLAASAFANSHCFWITEDSTPGTVLLHFQPADSGRPGGLEGRFSLDQNTSALREVSFAFVEPNTENEESIARASLRFADVSATDWFIASWRLQKPIVRTSADSANLLGIDEVGARALEVSDAAGDQVWFDDAIAVLYGTVFDSLENAPLRDGVVAIYGTGHRTRTDESGGFAIAGHWDGLYGVVFGHHRLDSVGFVSDPTLVELRRGTETEITLAVPALQTVLNARCPGGFLSAGRKALIGIVTDEASGQPVPGALVSIYRDLIPEEFQQFVSERSQDVAVADSLGMYTICDIPIGLTVSVAAIAADKQSTFEQVTFWENAVTYGPQGVEPLRFPVGRLDLTVRSVSEYTGSLSGTVTDAFTGFPMSGVNVTVEGMAQSTSTDSSGVFVLRNLPGGSVRLSLRKLGYRMLRHTADAAPGGHMVLSSGLLAMTQADPDAVMLDPITVEAQGVAPKLSEFEERRTRGFGAFATRDDFEAWNPTVATDVLRHMRGVRVRPNPFYGINGDTRRLLIEPSRDIGQRITRVVPNDDATARLLRGTGDRTVSECPMLLFLDGVYLGDSFETDVDNIVSTTDLSAVEVYSPSQVPVQFAYPGSTCGVIVFWSY